MATARTTQSEWFRNTDWTDAIEEAFFKKLSRARDKQQFLRIQAWTLASAHPAVALRLLDRYFTMGDDLFFAEAWLDKAKAHGALGDVDAAIAAFEAALAREGSHGKVFTNAFLDYPYFIATRRLSSLYGRALEVLDWPHGRVAFPAQVYKWNGVRAVILAEIGKRVEAREAAGRALEAAARTHSGLSRHPTVGLVGKDRDELRGSLEVLVQLERASLASRVKGWFGGS